MPPPQTFFHDRILKHMYAPPARDSNGRIRRHQRKDLQPSRSLGRMEKMSTTLQKRVLYIQMPQNYPLRRPISSHELQLHGLGSPRSHLPPKNLKATFLKRSVMVRVMGMLYMVGHLYTRLSLMSSVLEAGWLGIGILGKEVNQRVLARSTRQSGMNTR